jgi:hypothetical protein
MTTYPLDEPAVAAYLAYESAIMAKASPEALAPLRAEFLSTNALAQDARKWAGRPRLNYVAVVAARSGA